MTGVCNTFSTDCSSLVLNPIVSNPYSRNRDNKQLSHYNPVGDPFHEGQVKSTKAMSAMNRGTTFKFSGFYQGDSLRPKGRLRSKRGENYYELLIKP